MHLLLMADAGNAEFLEIVSGEVAQCFSSNVILTECRFVAFQTQASQPTCDIHRRFLGSVDARERSIVQADLQCPGTEDWPIGRQGSR
jgi:hypothetical protein